MVLLIDNYDSFTWNLVHLVWKAVPGCAVCVLRNDDPRCLERLASARAVIVSPGPGRPENAGLSLEIVQRCVEQRPLLGICLGHQCLVQAMGGTITRAARLVHGKTSAIDHDGTGLFGGLPSPFAAARYHSLVASPQTLPAALRVQARTASGEIMAVRHVSRPAWGVQFHPESFLSAHGVQLMSNFMNANAAAAQADRSGISAC